MKSYLLEHLRRVAADLADADQPSPAEARAVVGALVKRVEAIERYLADQGSHGAPASTPAAEPVEQEPVAEPAPVSPEPAEPAPVIPVAEPAPPAPAPEPVATEPVEPAQPEVFSPADVDPEP